MGTEVSHSTSFDPAKWAEVDFVAVDECTTALAGGTGSVRELLADIVRAGRKSGVALMPDVPPAWASVRTAPKTGDSR